MNFIRKISLFFVMAFFLSVVTACGGSSDSKKVNLSTSEIYNKGVSGVELPMTQEITSSEIKSLFGLSESDYTEATVNISMLNVKATEVAIFRFKDKGQEDAITKGIDKRIKDLEATWSTYLPDQYELVKGVKKFTYGNIKGYVIADDASKIISNIEKAVK